MSVTRSTSSVGRASSVTSVASLGPVALAAGAEAALVPVVHSDALPDAKRFRTDQGPLSQLLTLSKEELARQVLSLRRQLKQLTDERDHARRTLRRDRQRASRFAISNRKKHAKKNKLDSKKAKPWLPIERTSESKEFSWVTLPGNLASGVGRCMSSSSARGFGLAAGTPVSRQAFGGNCKAAAKQHDVQMQTQRVPPSHFMRCLF